MVELETAKSDIRRLSNHVLWAPEIVQARSPISKTSTTHVNLQNHVQVVDKLGEALGNDLLLTATSSTPSRFRNALIKNPYEILIDIRPIHRTERPRESGFVPVMFSDQSTTYIGWQKQALLPILLDCVIQEDPRSNAKRIGASLGAKTALMKNARVKIGTPANISIDIRFHHFSLISLGACRT
jgi:hypothetical protein